MDAEKIELEFDIEHAKDMKMVSIANECISNKIDLFKSIAFFCMDEKIKNALKDIGKDLRKMKRNIDVINKKLEIRKNGFSYDGLDSEEVDDV